MIDVVLLRVLKNRKEFLGIRGMIPLDQLEEKTKAIVMDFERYYKDYPSHESIDWQTFIPQFKRYHPTMKEDTFAEYVNIFKNVITKDADEDQRTKIVTDFAEMAMMTRLANLAERHANGDVADAWAEVTASLDQFRQRTGIASLSYLDTDIGELLNAEFDQEGVKWRLKCLQRTMRGLRPGDFGIIAGRPDKGKTSFLASELTYMAAQLPPDRNILWFNNEGPGDRIRTRLFQAALGFTIPEMRDSHSAGELIPKYIDTMGGRYDRIRVFDAHGWNTGHVEIALQENSPGIVVFDMIDNVRGFGDAARTDLMLEQMYQWARERCVKYDCIGMGTSQISADGDGLSFPTLGMLKDSKTGKQGACDFQLMIGAQNLEGFAATRYISLPKNKLRKPDAPGDPRAEVFFDMARSRFVDLETTQEVIDNASKQNGD